MMVYTPFVNACWHNSGCFKRRIAMVRGGIPTLFLTLLIFVVLPVLLFAADESITITTYYPSPYGSYNELGTNKLAVGDSDGSGTIDAGDQPPANGQIYASRSVIYKPQSSLPSSGAREGEVVYSNSDNQLYVYKGSSLGWQAVGVGGIIRGYGSSMSLPSGATYSVLCWATYFDCVDISTSLMLDGAIVRTYSGAGSDSDGCDQNTMMVIISSVSGGSHTWSTTRGSQQAYMWLAFEN